MHKFFLGHRQLAVAAMLTFALVIIARTAWLSDDAAITLRTVLNLVHGFGPTFNIDERVQAYTHPLWFALLALLTPLFGGNPFFAAFFLCITASMLVLWLLLTRVSTSLARGLVMVVALLLSRAFVDFATSGLENPLSHLLVIAFFTVGWRARLDDDAHRPAVAFLLCGLLYLTRADMVLVCAPMLALLAWRWRQRPGALLQAAVLGFAPVLAWKAFSFFYYGAFFPNTAYAKLGAGIDLADRVRQGGLYLLDSLQRDPLTLTLTALGIAAGLASRRTGHRAMALGALLYLAYMVSIGGDFMSGRYFTVPLLIGAMILGQCAWLAGARLAALAMAIALLGIFSVQANWLSGKRYENRNISPSGIADERGFYFSKFSLYRIRKPAFEFPSWQVQARQTQVLCGGLGYKSIRRGPGTHMIDPCGLADPLLARLPAFHNPHWRIGHFERNLPKGYEESVARNENLLTDPATRRFYDAIREVTRGPLWSLRRLKTAWDLQMRRIPPPDWQLYRLPPGAFAERQK